MGINQFGASKVVKEAVIEITAKQRALQNGTPKWLQNGSARACYAMLSNNSATVGGIAFYDKYFQALYAEKVMASTGVNANGNYQNAASTDLQIGATLFTGIAVSNYTATSPGSIATLAAINATNAGGEFGNAMLDTYSNSTATSVQTRNTSTAVKHALNARFVDSDHSDKTIVYLLGDGVFRAVGRINSDSTYDYPGTASFTVPNVQVDMWGSASYNNVRKELVVLSYTSAATFAVSFFQNINFEKYPSPLAAFNAAGVTRIDKSIVLSSWTSAGAESIYSLKPTLCDNGDVYVSVFHVAASFSLYKIVRGTDNAVTATLHSSKSVTTSYGRERGLTYGQRRVQSRDGGAVFSFTPYAHFGTGLRAHIIDKRLSTVAVATMFDNSNTTTGVLPMPFGDSGFCSYFCGNVYASSFSGGYVTASMERSGLGNGLAQTGADFLLPYFPLPNTTNFPGMTQVTDFSMLNNQAVV